MCQKKKRVPEAVIFRTVRKMIFFFERFFFNSSPCQIENFAVSTGCSSDGSGQVVGRVLARCSVYLSEGL